MSGVKKQAIKTVTAPMRLWSNKVLPMIGRRSKAAPQAAEDPFSGGNVVQSKMYGSSSQGEGSSSSGSPQWKKAGSQEKIATLYRAANGKDEAIQGLVDTHKSDPRAMIMLLDQGAKDQVAEELQGKTGDKLVEAKQKLFRGNTGWSKLGVAYLKADPDGKQYLDDCTDIVRTEIGALEGDAEIRPGEMKKEKILAKAARDGKSAGDPSVKQDLISNTSNDVTADIEEEFERRVDMICQAMLKVLDRIMKENVPAPVGMAIGTTVLAVQEGGLKDDEVRRVVGSFLMLRVVNPAIMAAAIIPKGQDANSSAQAQSRMTVNISKAIQNVANGVEGSAKEAFMKPLMEAIESRRDAMDNWFDRVAADSVQLVQSMNG